MKSVAEVILVKRERAKGRTQEQAAARAGRSVRTLRKYEQANKLPSQLKQPRTYRTRPNPFEHDSLDGVPASGGLPECIRVLSSLLADDADDGGHRRGG